MRVLQRAAILCGAVGATGASVQHASELASRGGAAVAADPGGEGSIVPDLAADQPGRVPRSGTDDAFFFSNSSTLLTMDMTLASAAAAAAAALPPPGAPTGATTRGRLSHASNFSAPPSGSDEPLVLDPGVQQLSDWEIQPGGEVMSCLLRLLCLPPPLAHRLTLLWRMSGHPTRGPAGPPLVRQLVALLFLSLV